MNEINNRKENENLTLLGNQKTQYPRIMLLKYWKLFPINIRATIIS